MNNMYYEPYLRAFGVSEHTPDLVDLMEPQKQVLVAYCGSRKCCQDKLKVIKSVPKETETCPDCSHYLFWRPKKIVRKEES